MDRRLSDVCLVLGATESFLPGALVAIASFLKQYPGFAGRVKPWMPETMLRWTRGRVRFPQHRAFALWCEAWLECLASAHLRAAAGRRPAARSSAG